MPAELELMLTGNFPNCRFDGRVLKLEQALALLAEQMFVLRIAVVVVVVSVSSEFELAQEACIDQLG